MTTLLTQDYLRTKGLAALEAEHHINVKRHSKYPNLVLLKYNQILTTMTPMTRECRGLILDEANNWECVCYTYSRFCNWGEVWGDTIDYSTSKCLEKVDGSLIQLYYYDNKWNCSTSGMPDAQGQVGDFDISFNDLFWNTWKTLGYRLPERTDICLAFELMSPFNQLVVRQNKSRIVLHGVRCLSDFAELAPEPIAAQYGWECVKSWPLTTIEEVVKVANELDPLQAEGFVVVDSQFHRIKVKSVKHVLLSHIRDNLTSSQRNMIELIRQNETGDMLAHIQQIEELKSIHDKIKNQFEALISYIEMAYEQIKDQPTQKDFALLAVKSCYSGALFAMRKGTSLRQYLAGINIKTLEDWLG